MRYPFIYSLSTVNLIYHGNFNYKLNPTSTSFVADSGVGKSVLADLLQLIFVGPGVYKSSTDAKGGRPFYTLVQGSNQGTGRGYAFVNVQLGPADFLLVGCLVEGATQQCTPFVVQQGEDFRAGKVRPMPRPLSWEAFIDAEGNVPTLKALGPHLALTSEMVLRDYNEKLPAYLQFLWDNQLTPLDLSKPRLLNDYAQIIRSFARSGELNQNPEYLEGFLFGDEAKDRIAERHKELLRSIARDQKTYADNGKRIKSIEHKIRRFTELDRLKSDFHRLQQQQLQQAWYVAFQAYRTNEATHQQTLEAVHQQRQRVLDLKTTYYTRLLTEGLAQAHRFRANKQRRLALPALEAAATQKQMQATVAVSETQTTEQTASTALRKAERVTAWLQQWGPDYEALRQQWQRHQLATHNQALSKRLWQHLRQAGQAENIQALNWHWGGSASTIYRDLETRKRLSTEAQAVAAYTNTDNAASLTHWALHRAAPLTPEQESVLAHFGKLATWQGREETSARFLETADLLINDTMHTEAGATDAGFWLCLAGTREWINQVPADQRLFGKPDKAETRALLARWQASSADEAAAQQRHYDTATTVLQVLQAFPQWEAALPLLPNADEKPSLDLPDAPLSLPELDEAIGLHTRLTQLRQEAQQATQAVENAKLAQTAAITEVANLQNEATQLRDTAANRTEVASRLHTSRRELRATQLQAAAWQLEPQRSSAIAETDLLSLQESMLRQEATLTTKEADLEKLRNAQKPLQEAEQAARAAYQAVLSADEEMLTEPQNVPNCPTTQLVDEAKTAYRNTFRDSIKDYLGEDYVDIYLPNDQLVDFLREVLPSEVHGVIGSTTEGQERLQRALHTINETNREIARRKFSELSFLIGDVRHAADGFFAEVLRLQSYFQREKTEITGGFRPFIRAQTVSKYPLVWLTEFQELAADPVAFEQLSQAGTVDDILLHAFRQRAGTDDRATVAKILNPVHYIKLDFEMRNEVDHINDGSNGQTFMAAALLNIARLAVIGRSGAANNSTRQLRFMAVDEAHDLGTNYSTLLELARKEGFQFISLSIRPLTHHTGPHQRLYFLRMGRNKAARQNLPPLLLSRGESVPAADEPFAPPPPPDLFTTASEQDAEAE